MKYGLDVVVPCYQESEVLPISVPRMLSYFRGLLLREDLQLSGFRLLLVDDGSSDGTWDVISGLAAANAEVVGIKLARNYGHQAAMLSGLSAARADVILSMDADLQDDISAVVAMLVAYQSGADLALGVREDRTSDSVGKRWSANLYYLILRLLGVEIIPNHADFRLLSRRALSSLLSHQEVNLFLRGLIPTIGFPVQLIPYSRQSRVAGETKYTLRKMIRLALDGITSFSVVPLRLVGALGLIVFATSALAGLAFLAQRLLVPSSTVPGWASIVLPLLALGGVQILSMAVIGEYVGKIYMEVKRRPRFIVETSTTDRSDASHD